MLGLRRGVQVHAPRRGQLLVRGAGRRAGVQRVKPPPVNVKDPLETPVECQGVY